MKEVTIVGYCDGNHEGDDRVRSQVERTISIDESKPVVLDLCGECDRTIQMVLSLMEAGTVIGKQSAPAKPRKTTAKKTAVSAKGHGGQPMLTSIPFEGPHICPECQFESVSRSALGQHLSIKHSKRFRDYQIAG